MRLNGISKKDIRIFGTSLLTVIWLSSITGCSGSTQPGYAANGNNYDAADNRTTSKQTLQDVEQYTKRIEAGLEQPSPSPKKPAVKEVQWLEPDPGNPGRTTYTNDGRRIADSQNTTTSYQNEKSNDPSLDVTTGHKTISTHQVMTDDQLLAELAERIRRGEGSTMDKASMLIALNTIARSQTLGEEDVTMLSTAERKRVEGYQQAFKILQQQLLNPDQDVSSIDLAEQLIEAFGRRPIKIRKVELVRRIDGWGVFETFDKQVANEDSNDKVTTLLAERAHKVGVYVEIDDFHPVQRSDGQWEVRLEHELELFNEADGLRIWRQPPMQVLDLCRNKRHDFFYRQLIVLPSFLDVGKYLLKVRVSDLNGQSVYEQTVPLHYVADPGLARGTTDQYMDNRRLFPGK